MNPNPYAPPEADVADERHPLQPPPRPVRIGCFLILASLVLGVVSLLPAIRVPAPDEPSVPLLVTAVIVLIFGGLTVWFAVEILRGRNWARWAMLVYLGVGWLLVGTELDAELARAPLAAVMDTVSILMEIAACGLLFVGAGGRWFSQPTGQRRADAGGE
jgi:hypothetical protein